VQVVRIQANNRAGDREMKWVAFICAAALVGCLIPVAYELTLLLQSARIDMDQLKDEYIGVALPAKKALADISAASLVIAQIGSKERNAFDAQNAYYVELGKQTTALLGEANAAITRIDRQTLPAIGLLAVNGSNLIGRVGDDTQSISEKFTGLIATTTAATESVQQDAEAARPGIDQLSGTAEEAHGTVKELHGSSTDFHQWTHRELAPVKGFYHTFKEILNLVFEGRGAVGF